VAAPTLLTDRLVLMPLGPADLDEVAALYADAAVMRHVDGGVRTRPETADALGVNERSWKTQGWGLWAIRDTATGGLVGEGGLQTVTDLVGVDTDFGYTLGRRHWGKGLATEAGTAILDDLWSRYGGDTIQAMVHDDHRASIRVLEKLGFTELDTRTVRGERQRLYSLDRPA
jgi:RimJ/RimL family protein N-acetyltransferase